MGGGVAWGGLGPGACSCGRKRVMGGSSPLCRRVCAVLIVVWVCVNQSPIARLGGGRGRRLRRGTCWRGGGCVSRQRSVMTTTRAPGDSVDRGERWLQGASAALRYAQKGVQLAQPVPCCGVVSELGHGSVRRWLSGLQSQYFEDSVHLGVRSWPIYEMRFHAAPVCWRSLLEERNSLPWLTGGAGAPKAVGGGAVHGTCNRLPG